MTEESKLSQYKERIEKLPDLIGKMQASGKVTFETYGSAASEYQFAKGQREGFQHLRQLSAIDIMTAVRDPEELKKLGFRDESAAALKKSVHAYVAGNASFEDAAGYYGQKTQQQLALLRSPSSAAVAGPGLAAHAVEPERPSLLSRMKNWVRGRVAPLSAVAAATLAAVGIASAYHAGTPEVPSTPSSVDAVTGAAPVVRAAVAPPLATPAQAPVVSGTIPQEVFDHYKQQEAAAATAPAKAFSAVAEKPAAPKFDSQIADFQGFLMATDAKYAESMSGQANGLNDANFKAAVVTFQLAHNLPEPDGKLNADTIRMANEIVRGRVAPDGTFDQIQSNPVRVEEFAVAPSTGYAQLPPKAKGPSVS